MHAIFIQEPIRWLAQFAIGWAAVVAPSYGLLIALGFVPA